MMINEKMENALQNQAAIIDGILTRYTEDETGESQKQKYNKMTITDKVNLLTSTLLTCADWCDFEADVIINFDYNNY